MKLTHTGIYHTGHSISMSAKENFHTYNQQAISFDTSCLIDIENSTPHDATQEIKLSINWVYSIYYHGINIFVFDTEERFDITEIDQVIDEAMIRDIATQTARSFVAKFNERQEEYNFLSKMAPISAEEINRQVAPIKNELQHLAINEESNKS